jgi:hypothetical protein
MNRKCVSCEKTKKPDSFSEAKAGVYHPRMYYTCVECVEQTEQISDPSKRLIKRIHEASLGIITGVNSLRVDTFNPESTVAKAGNATRLGHLGLSCQSVHGEAHARWLDSDAFIEFWDNVPDVVRRHQHARKSCKEIHAESHLDWVKWQQRDYVFDTSRETENKNREKTKKDAATQSLVNWILIALVLIGLVVWIADSRGNSSNYEPSIWDRPGE